MFRQVVEISHPVIDCGAQMGVVVRVLNLVPVWKLQWWGGRDLTREMRLVTYGCTDHLFQMWCVIPVFRSLQKSPIISLNDLIIQSEQALFTPLQIHRTKDQTCRGSVFFIFFFFFTTNPQEIIDHSLLLLECYWVGSWEVHRTVIQSVSFQLASAGMMESKRCFVNWNLRKWLLWERLPQDKNVLTGNIKLGN